MKRSSKKILYFITGAQPTKAQFKEAVEKHASFRNANHCGDGVNLEACDAVMGEVPKGYAAMDGVEILESDIEDDPDVPTTGGPNATSKPWEDNDNTEDEVKPTLSFAEYVALLDESNDKHWLQDRRPDCAALGVVGCEISSEARDIAWEELQVKQE